MVDMRLTKSGQTYGGGATAYNKHTIDHPFKCSTMVRASDFCRVETTDLTGSLSSLGIHIQIWVPL